MFTRVGEYVYLFVHAVHVCLCSCICALLCVCNLVYVHVSVALNIWISRGIFSFAVSRQLTFKVKTYGWHRVMASTNTNTHTQTCSLRELANDVTHPGSPEGEHNLLFLWVWSLGEGGCCFTENRELRWVYLLPFKLPQLCFCRFTDTSLEAQASNEHTKGGLSGVYIPLAKAYSTYAPRQLQTEANRHPK